LDPQLGPIQFLGFFDFFLIWELEFKNKILEITERIILSLFKGKKDSPGSITFY